MKKNLLAALTTACLLIAMVGTSKAAIYDPVADFSIANGNPNTVWSYGWMPMGFSVFNAFTTSFDGNEFIQWYTPGMSGDHTPNVSFNDTDGTHYGVAPGQLALHPGPSSQAAVLRFTAPNAGSYQISGQFFAGDGGSMLIGVREGSDWLWSGVNAGSFSVMNHALSAGESVDFIVYGGYAYGNTPLALTVSSVPAPAALLLLGTGLASLAGIRLRKKKR